MSEEVYRKDECAAILATLMEYEPLNVFPNEVLRHIAKVIERGILNSSVQKAKEKGIPTYWADDNFVALYASIGYTLKMNLDINSSVNIDKTPEIRYYIASRIYNYLILKYTKFLIREHELLLPTVWEKIQSYVEYMDPKIMSSMNSNKLNPLINKPYIEQIHIREQQETKIKFSTMYQCICGERKTISYEIQTRSLDEGGTQFIKCVSCNKVWTSRH
jgi:DNA-directed RNA polymerase subunit M/transcription elongation factor TFIIS